MNHKVLNHPQLAYQMVFIFWGKLIFFFKMYLKKKVLMIEKRVLDIESSSIMRGNNAFYFKKSLI